MLRRFTVSAYLLGLASATFLCLGQAMGQSAYFSLEGDFNAGADQHDFLFDLSRSVGSGEDLRFMTYTDVGGTNAAGDVIAASSFDSDLRLFDSLDGLRGRAASSRPRCVPLPRSVIGNTRDFDSLIPGSSPGEVVLMLLPCQRPWATTRGLSSC